MPSTIVLAVSKDIVSSLGQTRAFRGRSQAATLTVDGFRLRHERSHTKFRRLIDREDGPLRKPLVALVFCGAIAGCGSTAQIETTTSQPAAATPAEPATVSLSIDGYGTIRSASDTVTVAGNAEPGSNVLVDGIRAKMRANGDWSRKIHAEIGRHTVTVQASKPGRDDDIETITVVRKTQSASLPAETTPPAEHAAAPKPKVPLSRWAQSSFRGGYLAGRRDCGAYSLSYWADSYSVAATVPAVASAYADEHGYYARDTSLNSLARQAAYQGCVEGFEMQGAQ